MWQTRGELDLRTHGSFNVFENCKESSLNQRILQFNHIRSSYSQDLEHFEAALVVVCGSEPSLLSLKSGFCQRLGCIHLAPRCTRISPTVLLYWKVRCQDKSGALQRCAEKFQIVSVCQAGTGKSRVQAAKSPSCFPSFEEWLMQF